MRDVHVPGSLLSVNYHTYHAAAEARRARYTAAAGPTTRVNVISSVTCERA